MRMPVVKKTHVLKLGTEIKMRLRNKKLSLDKVLDWVIYILLCNLYININNK